MLCFQGRFKSIHVSGPFFILFFSGNKYIESVIRDVPHWADERFFLLVYYYDYWMRTKKLKIKLHNDILIWDYEFFVTWLESWMNVGLTSGICLVTVGGKRVSLALRKLVVWDPPRRQQWQYGVVLFARFESSAHRKLA